MSDSVVAARGLGRKSGAGDWLLSDVTMELAAGERVAISGPSGSGKSLLLRALALLDPTDAGSVLWRNRPIPDHEVPTFRSKVIYLHQSPQLGGPTVVDELQRVFSLRRHRDRVFDREGAVRRLERLGRGEAFLRRDTRVLSGGEAQIVALLRALQLEPDALLLDEPTAAVDPEAAGAIEALVNGWYHDGSGRRSLIWVGHDLLQSSRMTDRRLRIERGRVEKDRLGEGRPAEVEPPS